MHRLNTAITIYPHTYTHNPQTFDTLRTKLFLIGYYKVDNPNCYQQVGQILLVSTDVPIDNLKMNKVKTQELSEQDSPCVFLFTP